MSDTPNTEIPEVKFVNRIYNFVNWFGWEPFKLDKATLQKKALKQAGGPTDFGDPRYEEGLDALLQSINSENRLNGFGRLTASKHITKILKERLLITDHLKKHPEIYDEKIEKPLFIIGSARTGTTITHHLMSQDDRMRFPFTWECDELYPPLDPATMHNDPRIKSSKKESDLIKKMAPDIEAAHPMGPWEAQECALFMALEFASGTFSTMFNCPSYNEWLNEQDLSWVYARHKVMLQYMQSGGLRPQYSWILKTPPHMSQIDAILEVYPDARFITTYREPTEVVVSTSSLCNIIMSMGETGLDKKKLGARMCNQLHGDMVTNVEQRNRHLDKADQFIDLAMLDVVKQPLDAVKKIYDQFDIDMPDDVLNKMETYMDKHALETRKKHAYSAAEFGIDVDKIWHDFDFYRDFYNIPSVRK